MAPRARLPRSGPLVLAMHVTTKQLKALREGAHVTQERLAEILGIPVQHVSRVEAGQNLSLDNLERYAVALGFKVRVEFDPDPLGPQEPPPSKRQRTIARKKRRAAKRHR